MKHLLGLKSSSDSQQLNSRLIYHPDVFEFYTSQKDFSKEGLRRLEEAIQEVQVQATKRIVLHHPMTFENEYLEMFARSDLSKDLCFFTRVNGSLARFG